MCGATLKKNVSQFHFAWREEENHMYQNLGMFVTIKLQQGKPHVLLKLNNKYIEFIYNSYKNVF